jgi:hypothetical protein
MIKPLSPRISSQLVNKSKININYVNKNIYYNNLSPSSSRLSIYTGEPKAPPILSKSKEKNKKDK